MGFNSGFKGLKANLCTRCRYPLNERLGGWVLEPIWAFCRRENFVCCFWNSNAELSSPQPGHYTDYPIPTLFVSRSLSFSINFKIRTIFKKYVPTAIKYCVSIINKVKVTAKVKFTLYQTTKAQIGRRGLALHFLEPRL